MRIVQQNKAHRVRKGQRQSPEHINDIVDSLPRTIQLKGGRDFPIWDWKKESFGIVLNPGNLEIGGASVDMSAYDCYIYGGTVYHNTTAYSVAPVATNLTDGASNFIYVSYVLNNAASLQIGLLKPTSTATTYKHTIYEIYKENDFCTLTRVYHIGDVFCNMFTLSTSAVMSTLDVVSNVSYEPITGTLYMTKTPCTVMNVGTPYGETITIAEECS